MSRYAIVPRVSGQNLLVGLRGWFYIIRFSKLRSQSGVPGFSRSAACTGATASHRTHSDAVAQHPCHQTFARSPLKPPSHPHTIMTVTIIPHPLLSSSSLSPVPATTSHNPPCPHISPTPPSSPAISPPQQVPPATSKATTTSTAPAPSTSAT